MPREIFAKGRVRNELVVVFHGLGNTPELMRGVSDAASSACPDADVLTLPLAFGGRLGIFAIRPAESIAARAVERIEEEIRAHHARSGSYDRIILVGYSFGAVIARKVAIIAHGEQTEAPFEPLLKKFRQPRDWAGKIDRIVMLGGMNRGWSPAAARDWMTAAKWSVGSLWAELMAAITWGWGRPTISGIRLGAPFIVQTRLQWLALNRPVSPAIGYSNAPAKTVSGRRPILGVQLLGAADDLVAPDDSVDFACDLGSNSASQFALIELPFATHADAYRMRRPASGERASIEKGMRDCNLSEVCKRDDLVLKARWVLFERAISQTMDELKDIRIDPAHMQDAPAWQPERTVTNVTQATDVTDVVFVIHGIRDHGFWTQKIARVIKQEAERENEKKPKDQRRYFCSFTGSYGYFAMVPFVFPWVRRWKSEWLMDRYVEMRARHPQAAISFVGHSNGTYLLARALDDYPGIRFERVVLAGSVIRRDFDWASRLNPDGYSTVPRVKEVLNYVATRDWVVAIFSKAFQPLKFLFDLGSAGHDGFDQYKEKRHPRLYEAHYVEGRHSAALVETQWNDIARFILNGGPVPGPPDEDFKLRRSRLMVALGWISPALVLLLLWLVLGFGVALAKSVHGDGMIQLVRSTPAWQWHGFESGGGWEWLAAVRHGLLSVFNWIAAALQGEISTPFRGKPTTGGWTGFRAGVCAAYWWAVYIVASRF